MNCIKSLAAEVRRSTWCCRFKPEFMKRHSPTGKTKPLGVEHWASIFEPDEGNIDNWPKIWFLNFDVFFSKSQANSSAQCVRILYQAQGVQTIFDKS